jgi:hypothetical protein
MVENLTFGQALESVKIGSRIARKGWNGKDMFVFQRPYFNCKIEDLDKIQSIPQSVKDYFIKDWAYGETCYTGGNPIEVHFMEYLCMKDPLGNIINGWLASQVDMLSDDWYILD